MQWRRLQSQRFLVASGAPSPVTNVVTVAGGNEVNTANDTASDPTTTPVRLQSFSVD